MKIKTFSWFLMKIIDWSPRSKDVVLRSKWGAEDAEMKASGQEAVDWSVMVSGQQWVSSIVSYSGPESLGPSADGKRGSVVNNESCFFFFYFQRGLSRCRQMCRSSELFASCSRMSCVQENLQWERKNERGEVQQGYIKSHVEVTPWAPVCLSHVSQSY